MADRRTDEWDQGQRPGRLTRSAPNVIAVGILTTVAGIAILAWPSATLKVIAVVFGIAALITGVFRLVTAITGRERADSSRAMLALLAVIEIVIGILVLRHPFQTLTVFALLFGLFCVLGGIVQIVIAATSPGLPARGWALGAGIVTLAAGIALLVIPSATLVVATWLIGLQLVLSGASLIGWGVGIQRSARRASVSATPRTA